MKAVVIPCPGPPDVLEVRELPDPTPDESQVLVEVRATALNRADLLQRRGRYPAPPGSPRDVPGLEFSGRIAGTGARVRHLAIGDRVMGILGGGGYAEKVAVPAGLCLPVPPGLSWNEAAAVPEAFLTAWDALRIQADLSPPETLLVHAAASGVGTAAVQLGLALGCRVVGLSRAAWKRERLATLGLEHALDPGSPEAAEALRAITDGAGVDVILDLVGAASWSLGFDVAANGACIVVLGLVGGSSVELDLARLITRRLRIRGSVLRGRPTAEKIAVTRAWAQGGHPLLESGRVKPIVDRVFPLEQAARAHAHMEANRNFGKVVLSVGNPDGE